MEEEDQFDFHTIKSILNCTVKQYDILYDMHFHTIKSILNKIIIISMNQTSFISILLSLF